MSEKKRKRFRDRQEAEDLLRKHMRRAPGLKMRAAIDYLVNYHNVRLVDLLDTYKF